MSWSSVRLETGGSISSASAPCPSSANTSAACTLARQAILRYPRRSWLWIAACALSSDPSRSPLTLPDPIRLRLHALDALLQTTLHQVGTAPDVVPADVMRDLGVVLLLRLPEALVHHREP